MSTGTQICGYFCPEFTNGLFSLSHKVFVGIKRKLNGDVFDGKKLGIDMLKYATMLMPFTTYNFIKDLKIIGKLNRFGLRYIDFFENINIFEKIKLDLNINGEKTIIPVSENSIKAKTYGDMGRNEYEKDNYDKAMELYLKALDFAKNDVSYDVSWIYRNIGLLNLINKDINSSIDNYSKAISLLSNTNYKYYKSQIKSYKKDLKKLKKKHKDLEGIDTIMSMLESNQK